MIPRALRLALTAFLVVVALAVGCHAEQAPGAGPCADGQPPVLGWCVSSLPPEAAELDASIVLDEDAGSASDGGDD